MIKWNLWRVCFRVLILFWAGVFFAMLVRVLHLQTRQQGIITMHLTAFLTTLAVCISCGTLAVLVGMIYPRLHASWPLPVDWASVIRCIAIYMGINQANAQLEFANNLHVSVTLASMSVGLWWLFDRSRHGFGLGLSTAVVATFLTQMLTYFDVYKQIERDFFNLRYHAFSWLPCIFFSGGITIGSLGRQLANGDFVFQHTTHYD